MRGHHRDRQAQSVYRSDSRPSVGPFFGRPGSDRRRSDGRKPSEASMIDMNPFELRLVLKLIRDEITRIEHLKQTQGFIPNDRRADQEVMESIESKFTEQLMSMQTKNVRDL